MEYLATPRLTLRPVGPQDGDAVVAGLNDWDVTRWLAVVPFPYGLADFDHFLTEIARPGTAWSIEAEGAFAGIVSIEDDTLGYWLAPSAHGRGIATEAAGAALAAHFAAGRGAVASGYFEGNARSARVLHKLGFVETARDEKPNRAQGRSLPHVVLRLTADAFSLSHWTQISRG